MSHAHCALGNLRPLSMIRNACHEAPCWIERAYLSAKSACPLRSRSVANGCARLSRDHALSQVKKGMKGYGTTVFEGTKLERFDVEILGVLQQHRTRTGPHPGARRRSGHSTRGRHRRHERLADLYRRQGHRCAVVFVAVLERADRRHHADRRNAEDRRSDRRPGARCTPRQRRG